MIVATVDYLENEVVDEYLGIVTAEVVMGTSVFKDFTAGFSNFGGGRASSYESELRKGREGCLYELKKSAQDLKANAIVGLSFSFDQIKMDKGGMLMATACGTAVKLKNKY